MSTENRNASVEEIEEVSSFSVPSTSWGEYEFIDDIETLEKYRQFLVSLNNAGTWVIYLLAAVVCALSIYIVTETEFEKIIFYDGSEATCVLDSKTGVFKNVE